MAAPCVLMSSCAEYFNPDELIKQILGADSLPVGENVIETIQAYPWHLNTKYYTADIRLCTTNTRTIGDQTFADSVEAFVLYFDSDQKTSFDQVKSWLPFVKEISPEVQMIVCQKCDTTSVPSRKSVQEWCIKNGFELVELSPETEDEDEDDFQDSFGIRRIIQCLQAHTWPNLVLKERPNIRSPYFQQLMKEQAEENAANEKAEQSSRDVDESTSAVCNSGCMKESMDGKSTDTRMSTENKDSNEHSTESANIVQHGKSDNSLLDGLIPDSDMALFEALGTEDPDGESFEKLFENLRLMKEKADNLPASERKAYAEKVAMSFWRAIGGDEDEIATPTDSDND